MNSPDKLVVGTLIFLIGSTVFSIIDQFPYLLETTGIQEIEDFFYAHDKAFAYMHSVSYHISYCLQNIAIILSIGRWIYLVKSYTLSSKFELKVSLISAEQGETSGLDKVHLCILLASLLQTAVTMIIITLDMVQLSHPGVLPRSLIYIIICLMNLIVVPLFLFGYSYSYKKLTLYHEQMIYKYGQIFSDLEIYEIKKSHRDVARFFIYICQQYVVNALFIVIPNVYFWVHGYELANDIYNKVQDAIKNLSYIVMMFGISDSIKRAIVTQQNYERVANASVLNPTMPPKSIQGLNISGSQAASQYEVNGSVRNNNNKDERSIKTGQPLYYDQQDIIDRNAYVYNKAQRFKYLEKQNFIIPRNAW